MIFNLKEILYFCMFCIYVFFIILKENLYKKTYNYKDFNFMLMFVIYNNIIIKFFCINLINCIKFLMFNII